MQPFLAPVQVVVFFAGRDLHGIADRIRSGGYGLGLVKRLCADFTGMIDAHQLRGMFFVSRIFVITTGRGR
jgi:hypothetical protein